MLILYILRHYDAYHFIITLSFRFIVKLFLFFLDKTTTCVQFPNYITIKITLSGRKCQRHGRHKICISIVCMLGVCKWRKKKHINMFLTKSRTGKSFDIIMVDILYVFTKRKLWTIFNTWRCFLLSNSSQNQILKSYNKKSNVTQAW